MSQHRRALQVLALAFGCQFTIHIASGSSIGIPKEFTPQQIDILVSGEAALYDTVALFAFASENTSVPVGSVGSWSGSITNSGWMLNFSGRLGDTPAEVQQTGSLDLSRGLVTWSDSGFLGSHKVSIAGSGSATLSSQPQWMQQVQTSTEHSNFIINFGQVLDCSAVLVFPTGTVACGLGVLISSAFDGSASTSATFGSDGSFQGNSDFNGSVTTTTTAGQEISIEVGEITLITHGSSDGMVTYDASVNNPQIKPEPASFALVAVGILGAILFRRHWTRDRSRTLTHQ